MVDPISSNSVGPVGPLLPGKSAGQVDARSADQGFASVLREQLERVSQMQTEADTGIQSVLTGQSQNITEVFAAARKAELAFGLLMEIRNKLTDAYLELKRMSV